MWSSHVKIGTEISIASIPASQLAKEFGTPAFIMDEGDFVHAQRRGTARYTRLLVSKREMFITRLKLLSVLKLRAGLKILELGLMYALVVN